MPKKILYISDHTFLQFLNYFKKDENHLSSFPFFLKKNTDNRFYIVKIFILLIKDPLLTRVNIMRE